MALSDLPGKVDAILDRLGQSATYTPREDEDAYDVATGVVTPASSPSSVTISPLVEYSSEQIDGDQILSGDARIFAKASELTDPKAGDVITVKGVEWSVVNVKEHDVGSAGAAAIELQVRR